MPSPKETILVIDDDPDVLSLIEDMLHESGYTVLTTGDPQVTKIIRKAASAGETLSTSTNMRVLSSERRTSIRTGRPIPPLTITADERELSESGGASGLRSNLQGGLTVTLVIACKIALLATSSLRMGAPEVE